MKAGAGKRKGGAFERDVAKALSLWLTKGNDKTQLIRSVLSGGWQARGLLQAGDLAPNGERGEAFRRRFVVECKHRREIDLWALWLPGGHLRRWWDTLIKETGGHPGVYPLLVFRQNNSPIRAATTAFLLPQVSRVSHEILHARWLHLIIFPFADLLISDPDAFTAALPTV